MTHEDAYEAGKLYEKQAKIKLEMREKFTGGDEVTHYDVKIIAGGTLREFIDYILKHPFLSREWGHLGIKRGSHTLPLGDPMVDFNNGTRDTSNALFESYLDRKVVGVSYSGGWSYASWIFDIGQENSK